MLKTIDKFAKIFQKGIDKSEMLWYYVINRNDSKFFVKTISNKSDSKFL